jgi:hypothetical protein
LAAAFRAKGNILRQLTATLRHALGYSTWVSLEACGFDTRGKTVLVAQWLDGIRK